MTSQPGSRLHFVLAGGANGALWVAAGAAAVVLLLLLARYELRLVSRRAGLTLLGTRLLAVLVLVAALFEPTQSGVITKRSGGAWFSASISPRAWPRPTRSRRRPTRA